MSKKTLTILLLLSVAINLGVVGALGFRSWRTQPGAGLPFGKACPMPVPEYAALNLTDQQSRAWSKIQQELQGKLDEARQQLQTERQLLFDELDATEPNKATIAEQVAKIGALHQQMQKIVVDGLLEKRAFLSEQQWRELLALIGGHIPGVKCGMHGSKNGPENRGHGPKGRGPMNQNMGRANMSPAPR